MVAEVFPQDWEWLDQVVDTLDDDFVAAVMERLAEQIRAALDDVFS